MAKKQIPDDIRRQIDELGIADDAQLLIAGPTGDTIQIGFADFLDSHYLEQGYKPVGVSQVDDPDAPKDVPHPESAE